jgi:hypothetical protein
MGKPKPGDIRFGPAKEKPHAYDLKELQRLGDTLRDMGYCPVRLLRKALGVAELGEHPTVALSLAQVGADAWREAATDSVLGALKAEPLALLAPAVLDRALQLHLVTRTPSATVVHLYGETFLPRTGIPEGAWTADMAETLLDARTPMGVALLQRFGWPTDPDDVPISKPAPDSIPVEAAIDILRGGAATALRLIGEAFGKGRATTEAVVDAGMVSEMWLEVSFKRLTSVDRLTKTKAYERLANVTGCSARTIRRVIERHRMVTKETYEWLANRATRAGQETGSTLPPSAASTPTERRRNDAIPKHGRDRRSAPRKGADVAPVEAEGGRSEVRQAEPLAGPLSRGRDREVPRGAEVPKHRRRDDPPRKRPRRVKGPP